MSGMSISACSTKQLNVFGSVSTLDISADFDSASSFYTALSTHSYIMYLCSHALPFDNKTNTPALRDERDLTIVTGPVILDLSKSRSKVIYR